MTGIRDRKMLERKFARRPEGQGPELKLGDGSQVAVIGGGPAGSFFSYFLLDTAQRVGLDIQLDVYEPRKFSRVGPAGCNMCGGIISESLVQALAAEGINLPPTVVQRGIDSYVMHMDTGSVHIETPLHEKRIAAVHRGSGPKDTRQIKWNSFDGYLQSLALTKGANLIPQRVAEVSFQDGLPLIKTRDGSPQAYDLLAVAAGVNSAALGFFEEAGLNYKAPRTTKTFIREYYLSQETINAYVGSSMHVFLLKIPRLQFAAIIPKGDYVTVCLLGRDIDNELIQSFMDSPEVQRCMPPSWQSDQRSCQCAPRMNVRGAARPFADRLIFIGDSGVSRLYKDGIGAAYRTAKAAAATAVLHGISAEDFKRHYRPLCRSMGLDNSIGKIMFGLTPAIHLFRFARRAMLRMSAREQGRPGSRRRMSTILWDMFTGSAPYRHILLRGLHPYFLASLLGNLFISIFRRKTRFYLKEKIMETALLGKIYKPGQIIIRQGEIGDCMYVVQAGRVEVFQQTDGQEVHLATLEQGDFFGEMALFDREVRSATVRAVGEVQALTVDKKAFLSRIHEDPSLAFRIVQQMSHRIRELNAELARLET